jgi:hypothetical protein
MGLADDQKLLARLATDATYRKRFLAEPEQVDRAGLSAREVERFARSLLRKRLGEVEKLLPLSRRALGEARFAELFLRFARGSVPSGVKKHRDDAVAFAESVIRAASVEPAWASDLLRYESAALAATDPALRFVFRGFRHAIADLARAATLGGPPPPTRPTLGVWFRLSPRGRLRHVLLSLPRRPIKHASAPSPIQQDGSSGGTGPVFGPRGAWLGHSLRRP